MELRSLMWYNFMHSRVHEWSSVRLGLGSLSRVHEFIVHIPFNIVYLYPFPLLNAHSMYILWFFFSHCCGFQFAQNLWRFFFGLLLLPSCPAYRIFWRLKIWGVTVVLCYVMFIGYVIVWLCHVVVISYNVANLWCINFRKPYYISYVMHKRFDKNYVWTHML